MEKSKEKKLKTYSFRKKYQIECMVHRVVQYELYGQMKEVWNSLIFINDISLLESISLLIFKKSKAYKNITFPIVLPSFWIEDTALRWVCTIISPVGYHSHNI